MNKFDLANKKMDEYEELDTLSLAMKLTELSINFGQEEFLFSYDVDAYLIGLIQVELSDRSN